MYQRYVFCINQCITAQHRTLNPGKTGFSRSLSQDSEFCRTFQEEANIFFYWTEGRKRTLKRLHVAKDGWEMPKMKCNPDAEYHQRSTVLSEKDKENQAFAKFLFQYLIKDEKYRERKPSLCFWTEKTLLFSFFGFISISKFIHSI